MKPLILSAAMGYQPEQIAPFVNSLRRSGFKGTTAILVDEGNAPLREYLTDHGMEAIPVTLPPRWMPRWIAGRRFNHGGMRFLHQAVSKGRCLLPARWRASYDTRLVAPFHHIVNSRYFFYRNHLQARAARFSHVLLTDIRDVLFQADPFESLPARSLWLFQESSAHTLASDDVNRSWIEPAYGAQGLEAIGNKPILCAGTTLGSTGLILDYLREMTDELSRLTALAAGSFGYDQAVHNWLYWNGRLPEAEVKLNFHGPVATLHLESPDLFQFDNAGQLLNENGSPVALLHQYDRHPMLVTLA